MGTLLNFGLCLFKPKSIALSYKILYIILWKVLRLYVRAYIYIFTFFQFDVYVRSSIYPLFRNLDKSISVIRSTRHYLLGLLFFCIYDIRMWRSYYYQVSDFFSKSDENLMYCDTFAESLVNVLTISNIEDNFYILYIFFYYIIFDRNQSSEW